MRPSNSLYSSQSSLFDKDAGRADYASQILDLYHEVNERFPVTNTPDLKPFYEPIPDSPLHVAAFSSNSGMVTRRALELQRRLEESAGFSPFRVVYLFSDTDNPKGTNPFFEYHDFTHLAEEYGIPIKIEDIDKFYQGMGYKNRKDPSLTREEKTEIRKLFEQPVRQEIASLSVPVRAVVLDYYWSICTDEITRNFLTVNSHLGDLSVSNEAGRLLRGFYPVRKAIFMGHDALYSTTHIADEGVDHGELLVKSRPLNIDLKRNAEQIGLELPPGNERDYLKVPANRQTLDVLEDWYEAMMRKHCDSRILPLTLLLMAEGRFSRDGEGSTHFNGHLMKPVLEL